MSNYEVLPTCAMNNTFINEDLNESLSKFLQSLRKNKISYLTISNPKINEDFLFSLSLVDLSLQLKDMIKKPVVFISVLTFADLQVINQKEVKDINPNITSNTIVQIEVFFKADELYVKAKYQIDALNQTIK